MVDRQGYTKKSYSFHDSRILDSPITPQGFVLWFFFLFSYSTLPVKETWMKPDNFKSYIVYQSLLTSKLVEKELFAITFLWLKHLIIFN